MLLRINDVFEKKPCTNSDVQNMAQKKKKFVNDYILPLKKSFRKKRSFKEQGIKKEINNQLSGERSVLYLVFKQ